MRRMCASSGSRTRANCLEGNYPTVGPRMLFRTKSASMDILQDIRYIKSTKMLFLLCKAGASIRLLRTSVFLMSSAEIVRINLADGDRL
jgi:hypothetical protein